MDSKYWKSSPFGENSLFSPKWDAAQNISSQKSGRIVSISAKKGDYTTPTNNSPSYYALQSQSNRYSSNNTPGSKRVEVTIFVKTEGVVECVYISIGTVRKRAIDVRGQYCASFSIEIPDSEIYKNIEVSAQITDFIGKEIYDEKSYEVMIGVNGDVMEKDEHYLRQSVSELRPSQLFYLVLKEFEGTGNKNIIEGGEIVRFFPYDDGGDGKGNATIGYGHLIDTIPFDETNLKHAEWKDGRTKDEIENLLVKDVNVKIEVLERIIKVPLLQREYDALLLCLYNGGVGSSLIKTINKGVENLLPDEIFKAFLTRRYINKNESDGLIYRRAREAEIFVYGDYMPHPSKKFTDQSGFTDAFKKFLKTGVLPIIFTTMLTFFTCCGMKSQADVDSCDTVQTSQSDTFNEERTHFYSNDYWNPTFRSRYANYGFTSEYQYNEILFDSNDTLLMQMDTLLEYSTASHYYKFSIKKEKVTVSIWKWKDMPDNPEPYIVLEGYQKDGFVYIRDSDNINKMEYKIILGKCAFKWDNYNRTWAVICEGCL